MFRYRLSQRRMRPLVLPLAAILLAPFSVAVATPNAAARAAESPMVGAAAQLGLSSPRDFFPIHPAALVRPLGAMAPNTSGGTLPLSYAVPGLGVPLGGLGAGSFMINQSGTFGPWNFNGEHGTSYEMRALPQAAFHVREQPVGGPANTRTLAADGRDWESPLPAWRKLKAGEGAHAALYPFGWSAYEPFKTDVSMRYFSPIEAGQDRRTSLPVAYFDLRVANHTSKTTHVSTMFTMPNAPAHVTGKAVDSATRSAPASVREGFTSRLRTAGAFRGVTLSADSPKNTVDAAKSEWTIGTVVRPGQQFSYTTSWNAAGTGKDIYAPFEGTGQLPNRPIDSSKSAGAISVGVTLRPGEVQTIPFVLAWDFPQIAFAKNESVWMRRYTSFYGGKTSATNDYVPGSYPFHQSFAIAKDAAADRVAALRAVQRWWDPIANEQAYPLKLRMAALNSLATLAWNNPFWESGLVRHKAVATGFTSNKPGQHLNAKVPNSHYFSIQDTGAGGISGMGNTTVIQNYNYRATFGLFPNLQKARLLATLEVLSKSANGNTIDLYTGNGNPYLTYGNAADAHIQGGTDCCEREPEPGKAQWLDSPSKFIFEYYAYSQMAKDPAFLKRAWPGMQQLLAWLQKSIVPGTALPFDPPVMHNLYNIVPAGAPGIYNSQLYLLTLTVMLRAGSQVGADQAYLGQLTSTLAEAKRNFEALFWVPGANYYRFANAGPYVNSILADSFFAQHLARDLGLPDLVDPLRQRDQLTTHFPDFRQKVNGEFVGAPMLVSPGGVAQPDGELPPEPGWVWPGPNYAAAADYYDVGERYDLPHLRDFGVELAEAVANQVWLRPGNGLAFATPCGYAWTNPNASVYPAYSFAMASMDILNAIKPIRLPTSNAASPSTPPGSTTAPPKERPTVGAADGQLPATGGSPLAPAAVLTLAAALIIRRRQSRRARQRSSVSTA